LLILKSLKKIFSLKIGAYELMQKVTFLITLDFILNKIIS